MLASLKCAIELLRTLLPRRSRQVAVFGTQPRSVGLHTVRRQADRAEVEIEHPLYPGLASGPGMRVGVTAGRLYRRGDLPDQSARQPAPLAGKLSPQVG